mgnify:CR=1 FL=1
MEKVFLNTKLVPIEDILLNFLKREKVKNFLPTVISILDLINKENQMESDVTIGQTVVIFKEHSLEEFDMEKVNGSIVTALSIKGSSKMISKTVKAKRYTNRVSDLKVFSVWELKKKESFTISMTIK